MEDQDQRSAQIDLLRRLTPIELFVLRERCRGLTSSEIGAALEVSDEVASYYLGNVYDKLGVTYQHVGTSMGRLMMFCPLLEDIDAPAVPLRSEIDPHAEPPPQHPSARSLELVEDDDQALLAQRGLDVDGAAAGGRGWIYGLAAAIAVLLIAILAVIFLLTDDDDDDADATATALAALETPTTEPDTPTPVEEPPTEEPAPAEEPTMTPEPTPTEEPTPEPTETPEPTPTETPEPTPTETPEATATVAEPTATPQPGVTPTPQPQAGTEVFAADWSEGPGEWELTAGWTVEDGMLIGEGDDADPILAPFEPDEPDYAVEVVMTVENVDDCDQPIGLFVRVTPQGQGDDGEYLGGYVGAVCEDEWRISFVDEDQDDLEVLASGDFELDLEDQPHTYRIEVVGDVIRLFVDDDFVGEATDDRYADAGQVGLYLEGNARGEVEAFTIFELSEQ